MKSVIKSYNLPIQPSFVLKLPQASRVLFIENLNGMPKIWMRLDAGMEKTEVREFVSVLDNEEFNNKGMVYIGSIVLDLYIHHYFELIMPV